MKLKDVKQGMKVVPFQKLRNGVDNLDSSKVWNYSKKYGQNFLYVIEIWYDGSVILHWNNKMKHAGEYFEVEDFKDYASREKKLERILNDK